jgi:hypothetical protein
MDGRTFGPNQNAIKTGYTEDLRSKGYSPIRVLKPEKKSTRLDQRRGQAQPESATGLSSEAVRQIGERLAGTRLKAFRFLPQGG